MKTQGRPITRVQAAEESDRELEQLVLTRMMHLNEVIHGIIAGLGVGLVIFLATLWLVAKGGPVVGPHLGLLGQFFIGYDVSVTGSFVGFVYGLLAGFIGGYSVAKLYNLLVDLRQRVSRRRA